MDWMHAFERIPTLENIGYYVAQELVFCQHITVFQKGFYILHKIHSHCHLILDPESAFIDHLREDEAHCEVVVICRFRIQDHVAVAVDLVQNIKTL